MMVPEYQKKTEIKEHLGTICEVKKVNKSNKFSNLSSIQGISKSTVQNLRETNKFLNNDITKFNYTVKIENNQKTIVKKEPKKINLRRNQT